jgi:hypothetical protein
MLNFIKDYKDNEQYRESFNTLACKVFGITFESWPGFPDINPAARSFHPDEVLFIRTPEELMLPANFKHPLTSQA